MSGSKKTLVVGASLKPERVSNQAIKKLKSYGHEVVAIGLREGEVAGIKILKGKPVVHDVDTVTLYMNEKNQQDMMEYILSLKPKRIIFNPGAENPVFMKRCIENGIDAIEACTLVMLSLGEY